MTEQSPTSAFAAQTFLDGANADYIDRLQARLAADPGSVDGQWAEDFRALGETQIIAKQRFASRSRAHPGEPAMKAANN